jgi:hypothetical protein
MIKTYPLEWLDSLILQTFSPKNSSLTAISETDLLFISETIIQESQKIQIQIKNEVFSLHKKRQIRLLIRKYHTTFIFLLDNVIYNRNNGLFEAPNQSCVIETIINTLDELISFVETRYSNYLSLDERVPITYLIVSRMELKLKMDQLKKRKWDNETHRKGMEIVLAALYEIIVNSDENYKATYRQILYLKELLKKVDDLDASESSSSIYSPFDMLLISLNFNTMEYINYLISRIAGNIDNQSTIAERMGKLLLYFKELSQLYSNDKTMFEPSQQNIKVVLQNWFKHELAYLEKEIELSMDPKIGADIKQLDGITKEVENKIECVLSTDQMGLILRATDESRILKAKSMTQIFKTIVPHLSTPYKKDLSYQSVRSKSYNAEERDKEIAIQTLEKIIKKIKTY